MVFDLYRAVRKKEKKNRAISNAHYMSFFPSDWHFCLKSSRLPLWFSPQPRNPSHLFRFIITETHSTCPLTGIQFFLYLCIPLFIRNHMLMKSVIINLKYLIFRSVSASEGGWVEEQQSGEERGGMERACRSISHICIRCFKVGSNQSKSTAVFFHIDSIWSIVRSLRF